MKIVCRVGLLLLASAFLLLLFPLSQHVYADGGAPNLAYVAGAAHGIGVIDIGQQKVTSNISVDGDPQMILLSLDGRYLYVTQPTLGRVAIMSARTGKIICTASLPGQPSLLALGPESGALYAAGNGASIVSVLNPTNCDVQHTFQTQSPVYGIGAGLVGAGNNLHDQLWVSGTSSLTFFTPNGQPSGSIPAAGGPQYLSLPGGYSLYVTTRLCSPFRWPSCDARCPWSENYQHDSRWWNPSLHYYRSLPTPAWNNTTGGFYMEHYYRYCSRCRVTCAHCRFYPANQEKPDSE